MKKYKTTFELLYPRRGTDFRVCGYGLRSSLTVVPQMEAPLREGDAKTVLERLSSFTSLGHCGPIDVGNSYRSSTYL